MRARDSAIPLKGKVDLSRLGVLGHSRGGMNVLRWAKGGSVRSVFLLAPFFDPAQRVPDVPATLLLGTCDFDTHQDGAGYFSALKGKPRTTPAYQLTLTGANHNFYNQTLVALKKDDAGGPEGPLCEADPAHGRGAAGVPRSRSCSTTSAARCSGRTPPPGSPHRRRGALRPARGREEHHALTGLANAPATRYSGTGQRCRLHERRRRRVSMNCCAEPVVTAG